eukprot:m.39344 g.39344  ORF g.39344 m.39344 type:complete len:907 (+) comp9540_c0_seq1:194-2914(+)
MSAIINLFSILAVAQQPPADFNCTMKHLALQYANQTLGANSNLKRVGEALDIGVCPTSNDFITQREVRKQDNPIKGETEIYVSVNGSDSGSGSMTSPFATLQRAQQAARAAGPGAIVFVRAGTYYLNQTLMLNSKDSGTTYAAYQNERVILSGGVPLQNLKWEKWTPANTRTIDNCNLTMESSECARHPYKQMQNSSLAECCAACSTDSKCAAFTFHKDSLHCFLVDTKQNGVHNENAVCGMKGNPGPGPTPAPAPAPSSSNVYVTDLATGINIDSLFSGNERQWRARYPNGDPSKPRDGVCSDGKAVHGVGDKPTTLPLNIQMVCAENNSFVASGTMAPFDTKETIMVPCGGAATSNRNQQSNPKGLQYGPNGSPPTYSGGYLQRFTPPVSYWDSNVPSGIQGVTRATEKKWSKPTEWRVHAYHPIEWGNWGFAVGSFENGVMTFSRGGNQEARGGASALGDHYFAGMLEELDSPNEFYFDSTTGSEKLYWAPPDGQMPGPDDDLVAPVLETLISISGISPTVPADSIRVSGFTLMHSMETFCCDAPYEVVSGGDWSIHRGGMIKIENATNCELDSLTLDGPGGNGIFLNGFVKNAEIHDNEIMNAGDSLIAAVGKANYNDGRDGLTPNNCSFHHNHLHDWGVWGKQTSAFFAGITRNLKFSHNVLYNGPRAGINQNDGFAGGNEYSYNLVFNTVLDTGDHGNFNSWDRKPFVWTSEDESSALTANMIPNRFHIHNNFMVRTSFLGESMNLYCLDHDDGSSMYNDTFNFLLYGGIKFREGYSKHASHNLVAYGNGQDNRMVPFADQCRGTGNSFTNNTAISATGQFYGACAQYNPTLPTDHANIDYNTFYTDMAFSDGGCGGAKHPLDWAAWQKLGQDVHSSLNPASKLPTDQIVKDAMTLLGMA